MKVTIEMPGVACCDVLDCAYNKNSKCHARAITVGDGDTPGCDTFFCCESHCHSEATAGVGACKVSACTFNQDLECQAEQIGIGNPGGSARCMTFQPR